MIVGMICGYIQFSSNNRTYTISNSTLFKVFRQNFLYEVRLNIVGIS
jgi:hypothetical protein